MSNFSITFLIRHNEKHLGSRASVPPPRFLVQNFLNGSGLFTELNGKKKGGNPPKIGKVAGMLYYLFIDDMIVDRRITL